jgi:hypothetical protein
MKIFTAIFLLNKRVNFIRYTDGFIITPDRVVLCSASEVLQAPVLRSLPKFCNIIDTFKQKSKK